MILQFYLQFEGDGWRAYDQAFRLQAARIHAATAVLWTTPALNVPGSGCGHLFHHGCFLHCSISYPVEGETPTHLHFLEQQGLQVPEFLQLQARLFQLLQH